MEPDEWKAKLSPEQYRILREKGTEPPGTGKHLHNKEDGMYLCAACGNPIFSSIEKFDSGSGWPSFFAPISEKNVIQEKDDSFGMIRTEVQCSDCRSHLGHFFSDGPKNSRFCINSLSLDFKKA